jgi:3-hydroxyacyl-CoA dehydrogenase/enoyl-CoA hydratase/3-hydroxybutyryl-CoA epimerase
MPFPLQIHQGVAILTLDAPGRSANVLDEAFIGSLQDSLKVVVSTPGLHGLVLCSAKTDFVVGADLDQLFLLENPAQAADRADAFKALLRRLETWGKPVVAALNGSALGGGLELALACHHRLCLNQARIRLGLPEVRLGLLPGGGGTQRLPRLIGIKTALPLLLEGTQLPPQAALQQGLVNALVENQEELLPAALDWIAAHPELRQPWDQPGFRIPGGGSHQPDLVEMWAVAPAMLHQKTQTHYPAPLYILSCVYEGSLLPFEQACRVESAYFGRCACGPVAKNMMRALWFQQRQLSKRQSSAPLGTAQATTSSPNLAQGWSPRKIGILGAGMMGSGIAGVCAQQGCQVVLLDVDLARAEAARESLAQNLEKQRRKKGGQREDLERLLACIHPTASMADLAGSDVLIEAVFENRQLKDQVIRAAEPHLAEGGIFGSNTSTLPISSLARSSRNPAAFIGLHFFSPVDRMPLLEIIKGKESSRETIDKALLFARILGKTPIVVGDGRGFYTSRVFSTYMHEGFALLEEGQDPCLIEAAGLRAGMAVGPLAVADEISLQLIHQIRTQALEDLRASGKLPDRYDLDPVIPFMVERCGRLGRKSGAGFYDYTPEGKRLWPALRQHFLAGKPLAMEVMVDRLLFVQALDAVRCLQEGVLSSVAEANLGSILGWGFPAFTGGILQFLNDYGLNPALQRCRRLARSCGRRFHAPDLLKEMAASGRLFLDREEP